MYEIASAKRQSAATDFFHILILSSFAITQPLLDLLGRNATFFVARDSRSEDILGLVLVAAVLVPVAAAGSSWAISRVGESIGAKAQVTSVAILTSMIAMPVLRKILTSPDHFLVLASIVAGISFSWGYSRHSALRRFVSYLALGLPVFPAVFLLSSDVSEIVLPSTHPEQGSLEIDAAPPIVFVVFDEFTATSLLNDSGRIDEAKYPSFSALADDSYWFQNATTVSDHTHVAIPAILTGLYPDGPRLPTIHDYPENLFSWLGTAYELNVHQSVTAMCPKDRCATSTTQESYGERMASLLSDVLLVYVHVLLPSDLTVGLSPINQSWKHFAGAQGEHQVDRNPKPPVFGTGLLDLVDRARGEFRTNRGRNFRRFVSSIEASHHPTLHFYHALLPHLPYEYLPSGKHYSPSRLPTKGLMNERWSENESLTRDSHQRYLLQLGFVDKLLGELISRLEALDLYDQSLVVITADHGVSFRPGDSRRKATDTNYPDIMHVPLFIKLPGQRTGVESDRNVQSIDLLPTIADALEAERPWKTDGLNALQASTPAPSVKTLFATQDASDRRTFGPTINAERELLASNSAAALDRQYTDANGLSGDTLRNLLRRTPDLSTARVDKHVTFHLDNPLLFESVDLRSNFVPAYISGRLDSPRDDTKSRLVGIVVNNQMHGTAMTSEDGAFSLIVPEHAFRSGRNRVNALLISRNENNEPILLRAGDESRSNYILRISTPEGIEYIAASHGEEFQVLPGNTNSIRGFLDNAVIEGEYATFSGWAGDVERRLPADHILMFVDGGFVFSTSCNAQRNELADHFQSTRMRDAGFRFSIPLSNLGSENHAAVRLFAISKNKQVAELTYPEQYHWR